MTWTFCQKRHRQTKRQKNQIQCTYIRSSENACIFLEIWQKKIKKTFFLLFHLPTSYGILWQTNNIDFQVHVTMYVVELAAIQEMHPTDGAIQKPMTLKQTLRILGCNQGFKFKIGT